MLRLVAADAADLAIISAQMQDGVLRRDEMSFDLKRRRFSLVANRFVWDALPTKKRCRVGLHFDDVQSVSVQGVEKISAQPVLSLLAITFVKSAGLAGIITLAFSGKISVRLQVSCINATMADLSEAWGTAKSPTHQT